MQPTQAYALDRDEDWMRDYPAFRPLAFSADAFLPLVNLHQETHWTPQALARQVGLPAAHIIAGWVITTLAAVSFTGIVRREDDAD